MKLVYLILNIVTFSIFTHGQSVFNVDFDARQFSESDSTGRIEIYYTFYHNGMKSNKNVNVNGLLAIKLFLNATNEIIINKKYSFEQDINLYPIATTGILKYSLKKGTYNCELKATDLNNLKSSDSISFIFTINGYNPKQFSVSDIQFATSIIKTSKNNSPFYKNNYEIIPNTSGIYGETLPVLYFYSELYNLNRGTESKSLKLRYSVYNQYEEEVFFKVKKVISSERSIIFAESVNVSKFPSGSYKLELSLSDSVTNKMAKNRKRFTIINPNINETKTNIGTSHLMLSEFGTMRNEQLAEVFLVSRYLASQKEIAFWGTLKDSTEKQEFLYQFWKKRDATPGTINNETKQIYFNRVEIANKRFDTFNKKGSLTDRGRVFCIYGEPNEIERYPNKPDLKPYEIWHYYTNDGNTIFVFAKINLFTEMQLIHSNKIGELQNPSWQDYLNR